MKKRALRRLGFAAAFAVSAMIAVFAFWPREPTLTWYESPTTTILGKPRKVRLLIPAGWKVDPVASTGTKEQPDRMASIAIHPARSGFICWVKRALQLEPIPESSVNIVIQDRGISDRFLTPKGYRGMEARKLIADVRYVVVCRGKANVPQQATFREICKSLQVLK
jgi:hypothetical protein